MDLNGCNGDLARGIWGESNGDVEREHKARLLQRNIAKHLQKSRWKTKTDFYVVVISYMLGLGNVLRFPYLCHKNGGGAFLIPYLFMLIVQGIPLVYLEMAIGQRMQRESVVAVWRRVHPSLCGVGLTTIVVTFLTVIYYNVLVAFCFIYFVYSMSGTLPPTICPSNSTVEGIECEISGPSKFFWNRKALDISSSIYEQGINWEVFGFLVAVWVLVWLCTMKGVKQTKMVFYVVLGVNFALLIVFFFVGVHLDGWAEGLALLFIPKMERLKDYRVWQDASSQVFYSLGVGYGSLISYSSFNNVKNNCFRDAYICALTNCATSVYASVVMFSFIGFIANYKSNQCLSTYFNQTIIDRGWMSLQNNSLAQKCNKTVFLDKIPGGHSLAFVGMTEAFSEMPNSNLWSSLYFLLLFLLGVSSMPGMVEVVITSLHDITFFHKWRKESISGFVCLCSCLLGLIFVQNSGYYFIEFIESFIGNPLLITVVMECVGVTYMYGIKKFCTDIQRMTGSFPRFHWRLFWAIMCPLLVSCLFIMGIIGFFSSYPEYKVRSSEAKTHNDPYPVWLYILALTITFTPIFIIIGGIFHHHGNNIFKRHLFVSGNFTLRTSTDSSNSSQPVWTTQAHYNPAFSADSRL